jgi:uncharacterized membrane protein YccC
MQLNRRNFLNFLIQSEPGKPAIANGLRSVVVLGIPMLVGHIINQKDGGLFFGLVAYLVNLANVGGPYQSRAKAIAIATFGIAISVFVGTLVGNIPVLAVVLTFFWGLGSGMALLYGSAGVNVGLVVCLAFIVTTAQPGSLGVAIMSALFCVVAGGWGAFISLFMWPFRPDLPLQNDTAECFWAIATYLQAYEGQVATTATILPIRTALDTARTGVGTAQIGSLAPSWLDEQLLVLIQDGERLLGSSISLTEILATHFTSPQHPIVGQLIDDALAQLAIVLQSIGKVIAGKSSSIDFGELHRIEEALKTQQLTTVGTKIDDLDRVALNQLVLTISKLIEQLEYTAVSAKSLTDRRQLGQRPIDLLPSITAEQQSFVSLLTENFTLSSAIFRHALRLGFSLSLGVALSKMTNVPMGYWIPIAIILGLRTNFGATFQRFVQRIGGNVLGAVLATVIIATISSRPILDIIILLAVFFGIALTKIGYGYAVVCFSMFVLLVSDFSHPLGWEFAGFRILNTFIGAGIALGSHYLFRSNCERDPLPTQLATALRADRQYFSDVMAVYQGAHEYDATIARQRRQTGLAIGNAHTSFQGLLLAPRMRQASVEPVMTLLVYMERFANAVTVLAVHLEHVGSIEPLPELATFSCQILLTLEQLADAVEQETTPPPLPDLAATINSIRPHLQALPTAPAQKLAAANPEDPLIHQAVMADRILDLEGDQIVRRLTAIHAAIVRLQLSRRLRVSSDRDR